MSDFDDDELRRLLGDDRLGLTPRADAVGRIVKGAHRRRTIRVVASAAGSVGLVAALALGSVAVSGQFTAGPEEPQPAVTPSGLLPGPDESDDGATEEPSTPVSPPESAETDSDEPDAAESGSGDPTGEGEENTTPPDTSQVVLDPDVGIDGYTVGTPLADLEALDGVELTPYGPERGISAECYGEYASTWAHGTISIRDTSGDEFQVATMRLDVAFITPENIGIGSTEADVMAAYPSAAPRGHGELAADLDDGTGRSWVFTITDGLVSDAMLDGGDRCDEPAAGDDPAGYRVPGDEVFAPVRLGMTVDELRQLGGVRITEMAPADQAYCYGTFEYEDLVGMISVRRDFASETGPSPAESEDDYRVTFISSAATAATTPLGIGPGASLDDVRQAYPDLVEGDTFDPFVPDATNPAVHWLFESDGDTVTRLVVDAGQNCAG